MTAVSTLSECFRYVGFVSKRAASSSRGVAAARGAAGSWRFRLELRPLDVTPAGPSLSLGSCPCLSLVTNVSTCD